MNRQQKRYRAILMDLDGTLLPEGFEKVQQQYMHGLATQAIAGQDPQRVVRAVYHGMKAMVADTDPAWTNEQVFWRAFEPALGVRFEAHAQAIDAYYRGPFGLLAAHFTPSPQVRQAIRTLKAKGYRLVVATNPLFPAVAQTSRIGWAGLDPSDFELVTHYANMHACKPNLEYYREICAMLEVDAKHCLMVGNDAEEDMVAGQLGMDTFFIDETPIQRMAQLPPVTARGGYADFLRFVEGLPEAL